MSTITLDRGTLNMILTELCRLRYPLTIELRLTNSLYPSFKNILRYPKNRTFENRFTPSWGLRLEIAVQINPC